jgi:inner membrane protein
MHRTGHIGAALLLYAPVAYTLLSADRFVLALIGELCVLALASLPDIDLRVSWIGHRRPTHTIAFAIAVGLTLGAGGWTIGEQMSTLAARFVALSAETSGTETSVLGYITGQLQALDGQELAVFGVVIGTLSIGSHLIADAITPRGIKPFWPISSQRYSFNLVKAANRRANQLLLVLGALAITGAVLFASLG